MSLKTISGTVAVTLAVALTFSSSTSAHAHVAGLAPIEAAGSHDGTSIDSGTLGPEAEVDGPAEIVDRKELESSGVESSGCGYYDPFVCDGKSPQYFIVQADIVCADDAVTVDVRWLGSAYVELRYSPFCRTVWVRTNLTTGPSWGDNQVVLVSFWNKPCNADNQRTYRYIPAGSGVRYSMMLNDASLYGYGYMQTRLNGYINKAWTTCY